MLKKFLLTLPFILQLFLYIFQYQYNILNPIFFALLTSSNIALSVLLNRIDIFLPVIKNMKKVKQNSRLLLQLKLVYAVLMFLGTLLGSFIINFYTWIWNSVIYTGQKLNSTPDVEIIPFAKDIVTHIFLSPTHNVMFFAAIIVSILFIAFFSITKHYGPRAQVYKIYGKQHLKFTFHKQETRLETIAVGIGLGLSFYFSLMFLALATLRSFTQYSFDDWIRDKTMNVEDNFDNLVFDIYKHIIISTILWLPFYNINISGQLQFSLLLISPIAFAVILSFIFRTFMIINKLVIFTLKSFFSIAWILGALFQFIYFEANPLLYKINEAYQVLDNPELLSLMLYFSKTLFLVVLVFISLEIWRSKEDEFRLKNDPFGCFYQIKIGYFLFSIFIRVMALILFFQYKPIFGDAIFDEGLKLMLFALSTLSVLMIESEHPEIYLKDLRNSFSQIVRKNSLMEWEYKINVFRKKRDYFNIMYLSISIIIILGSGGTYSVFLGLFVIILTLFMYFVILAVEYESSKIILEFELKLYFFNAKMANRLTFGLFKKYKDNFKN